jgi:hypothetical protein
MDPIFGVRLEDVCHVVFIVLYIVTFIVSVKCIFQSIVGWYTTGFV